MSYQEKVKKEFPEFFHAKPSMMSWERYYSILPESEECITFVYDKKGKQWLFKVPSKLYNLYGDNIIYEECQKNLN